VVSGVFESPWNESRNSSVRYKFLANWTLAPRIEIGSGRPYRLLTRIDQTLINSSSTARPSVVPLGTPGSVAAPDGRVALAVPELGSTGNLGRNVYRSDGYRAIDFRLSRRLRLADRARLNLMVDVFNCFNHVNISEVDNTFTHAGRPVAGFNPRQIQFGVQMFF